jgi:predicted RND superfamily exporter protein
MVRLPDDQALESPATLERVAAVESVLEEVGGREPISVLAPLRVAQREVAGGEARLPDGPEAAAQLLLLLEAADPVALARVLTPDRRVLRLSVPYASSTSDSIWTDTERVRQVLAERFGGDGAWSITGSVVLLSHLADLVLAAQTASFSTAFATIFLVIFAVVRSLRLGLLGMLPNVLPVAAILGLMGASDIHLDVGTAMIASIVLGVSVDDTIYFLLHYRRARSQGAGVRDAVAYTLAIAGKPALFCSAVLALGFFVLAFSSFQTLAIFGLLSGFAVLLAAASELFVLPAVLELAARRKG